MKASEDECEFVTPMHVVLRPQHDNPSGTSCTTTQVEQLYSSMVKCQAQYVSTAAPRSVIRRLREPRVDKDTLIVHFGMTAAEIAMLCTVGRDARRRYRRQRANMRREQEEMVNYNEATPTAEADLLTLQAEKEKKQRDVLRKKASVERKRLAHQVLPQAYRQTAAAASAAADTT